MSQPFGPGPLRVTLPEHARPPAEDMELGPQGLATAQPGDPAHLDIAPAAATAAFSRLDALRPGYQAAREAASAQGFAPVLRPVGGHLAAYGDGALVLHLWGAQRDATAHLKARFALAGGAIVEALRGLGVDAHLGPVPDEYCSGEFSVNAGHRVKLVGTGQRLTSRGYLFSAVVMVHHADRARRVLGEAYRLLDLPFDPATVGCVADCAAGVSTAEVRTALVDALAALFPLSGSDTES